MGQIAVAQGDAALRTLLGSCIGLVLYDRRLKLGGLAHIVLPKSTGKPELPGKFADTAVPALIEQLQRKAGEEKLKLTAKIAGGANMFNQTSGSTVGELNIQAIEQILAEQRIPVIGRHLGGEQGRRLGFDLATGSVVIEIVGAEAIQL